MKNIENSVIDYLDNHMCILRNKHSVEICMHDSNYFSAGCRVPGFEDKRKIYTIGLHIVCESIGSLIQFFSIKEARDLESVTPVMMLNLYENGDACIYCTLSDYMSFGLQFRKLGKAMFATDNFDEKTHAVGDHLKTQDEFYRYTVSFYKQHYNSK
jgi:hypothetical protein